MKKILRNLTIVLLVSMMIGTTCFAAEEAPKIYVDGVTIDDFAVMYAQKMEEKKATKQNVIYTYQYQVFGNSIVFVELELNNSIYNTTVTSIILDPVYDEAIINIDSVINGVPINDSSTFPINIEIK